MLYSINLVTTQCSCVNQKVNISTDNCSYPETCKFLQALLLWYIHLKKLRE